MDHASPSSAVPESQPADWSAWYRGPAAAAAGAATPPPLPVNPGRPRSLTFSRLSAVPERPAPAAPVLPDASELLDATARASGPQIRVLLEALLAGPPDARMARVVAQACSGEMPVSSALDLARLKPGPAVAEILRVFPGPLKVNVFAHDAPALEVGELCPLAELLIRLGPGACAMGVARGEGDANPFARYVSVLLAPCALSTGVVSLVAHRLGDAEPRIAYLAASVIRALLKAPDARAETARATVGALVVYLDKGQPWQQEAAIRAATIIPDRAFVAPLLQVFLGGGELAEPAHAALVEITRHDFGQTGKTWTRWWQEQGQEPRVEWLLEALETQDARLAEHAQRDLYEITGQHFGYATAQSWTERRAVLRAAREWWAAARHQRAWP